MKVGVDLDTHQTVLNLGRVRGFDAGNMGGLAGFRIVVVHFAAEFGYPDVTFLIYGEIVRPYVVDDGFFDSSDREVAGYSPGRNA